MIMFSPGVVKFELNLQEQQRHQPVQPAKLWPPSDVRDTDFAPPQTQTQELKTIFPISSISKI